MLKSRMTQTCTMRALAAGLMTLIAACSAPQSDKIDGDHAFVGVNVVDVDAGTILPDRTVVIAGENIAAVLPSADAEPAEGVAIVDGSGRYLAPGLMDMHTHMSSADELTVTLAHGVTTVRVLWGQPSTLKLRAAVEAGEIPGPRVVTAGDLMDGDPPIWAEIGMDAKAYTDPEAMDAIVAGQKAAGYDFIKTYSRLTPDVFDAVLAAGRKHGIEVSGHVPQDVPLRDAIDGGMRTSEHFIGVLASVLRDENRPNPDLSVFDPRALAFVKKVGRGEIDANELIDPDKVAAVAEYAAGQDHWFVPTHDIMRNFTNDYQRPFPEALRYMTPAQQAIFEVIEDGSFFKLTPVQKDGESMLYELRTEVLKAFHEAGAKIMVGTDHSMLSGPATVAEIKALRKAGFSRLAALRAATREPGRYLGYPGGLGVVTEGAIADLILLDGDPLQNLDALKRIDGVMSRGVWYDRTDLDAMLDDVARRAASSE